MGLLTDKYNTTRMQQTLENSYKIVWYVTIILYNFVLTN